MGNNIVNITAATLGTLFFTKLSPEYGATISTVVLTLVILTFGEISPKTIAKEHAEGWAMTATPLLRALSVILRPLTILFSLLQKLVGSLFHTDGDRGITEDELITMVSTAEDEGGLDQNESRLIRSAIEFGDMEVEEILTPRVDIVSISDQASAKELDELISSNRFSRIPVWHGSIDTIIGMIHEKDFHEAELGDNDSWKHLISPVIYVTTTSPVADLLYEMQRRKMHMSVVVDEYGGTEGLVTLEEILEELVGEIWERHDEVVERIREQEDGFLPHLLLRQHRRCVPAVRPADGRRYDHPLRLGHRLPGAHPQDRRLVHLRKLAGDRDQIAADARAGNSGRCAAGTGGGQGTGLTCAH